MTAKERKKANQEKKKDEQEEKKGTSEKLEKGLAVICRLNSH